jgi:hypothetical protein
MLALGLVVGAALGGLAVSQRSQIKRLNTDARGMDDELVEMERDEAAHGVFPDTSR